MAKLISVCTQKGGVGKTTLTMLLATYYHTTVGKPVTVIDADFPQHSFDATRRSELASIQNDEEIQSLYVTLYPEMNRELYKVYKGSLEELAMFLTDLKGRGEDELVFIDMPGTMNVKGFDRVASQLDYVILPMEADKMSFTAGLQTLDLFDRFREAKGADYQLFMLWNKYKKSENPSLMQGIENIVNERGNVQILEHRVTDSVTWKRERSTLFPSDKVKNLVGELNQLLNITQPVG
ncbi:ParA family protein [Spirosoma linguale]|uniref:ATPase-like protein involved in chromosome partitioning n=1 Tax=Spirosoma linguale (strain ATCC 33905 / DSM 74 / LMG 10896 / Claus 1) TaxID=504472 RepID=D2QV27_SPILD|nr:ATPase-like protein involved in chromosome partitioning [Spirosoma linguale DSM 74]